MSVLAGKTIVLGVSGGIAAYKAAEIVRLLVTSGANVRVMMTRNAAEFITPLTLQTLSQNPVATDTFSLTQESEIGHIRLADSADAILIAPATADVIAKAAVGIADDILTTVLLATRAKIVFAPAMNVQMYEHPTVAENLAKLRARGVVIIDPAEGALACGYEGKGRLPDPAIVVAEVERMLSPQDLAGEKILVTAGPTQEPIDPVRFVSNRSSGKMGFAIARAARRRGAEVKLVAGPSSLDTPYGIERIESISAQELLNATARNFPWCTTLVMAAAVADFRPANPARTKIKKDARGIQIAMEPIADAMPHLAAKKGSRLLIGFAAETNDLETNARDKLKRKRLDLIVANDVTQVGAGFGVDTNIVTLVDAEGRAESHPQLSKDAVADLILDRVAALHSTKSEIDAAPRRALMRDAASPLDRRTLVESIRDYVEQLREEGLEGLPASSAVAPGAIAKATATAQAEPTPAVEGPKSEVTPGPSVELISKYPGLEKTSTLDELREFIGDCRRCKLAPCRTNLVFGVGNPNAQLMFVGEAPGADEDARGEPFVGRAGQLLTDIIERGMGISRSDVYICNVIKCRPPDNRNPEPDEVAACEPFLMRQIDMVRPRAIIGLGTFAVHAILKIKTPISKLRGNWHELRGIRMMPTFHPAYLLRNPGDKRLVWADIQEVMKFLGMPIPRRGGSS